MNFSPTTPSTPLMQPQPHHDQAAPAFYPTGVPAPAPQKPQVSADAILSLYTTGGNGARAGVAPGMGMAAMGGHHAMLQQPSQPMMNYPPMAYGGVGPTQAHPMQHMQQPHGMGYPAMQQQPPMNPFAPLQQAPQQQGGFPNYPPSLVPQQRAPQQQPWAGGGMNMGGMGVPHYNPPPVPPQNPFLSHQQQYQQQPPAVPQWPGRS